MANQTVYRYYKPGLSDSNIAVTAEDMAKTGVSPAQYEQNLKNSGYIFGDAPTTPTSGSNNPNGTASSGTGSGTTSPVSGESVSLTDVGISAPKTKDQFIADRTGSVDEDAIREQVRKEQQARIDATNAVYDSMVSNEQIRGTDREGQTRAINARSGLLGQDFGNSIMADTKNKNAAAIDSINAERRAKILDVLDSIDKMASDRIKAQKEEALGNADAYTKYLTDSQEKARSAVKSLGANGTTFQQLKEKAPDKLKTLLESTGYDEFQLAAAMGEADKQNKFTYKVENGVLMGYRTNPQTGEPEVITKTIPGLQNGSYKVQMTADGTALIVPENIDVTKPLDEQIKIYGKEGQFAKQNSPVTKIVGKNLMQYDEATNSWKVVGKAPAIPASPASASETKIKSFLSNVVGKDGFVSPDSYLQARNAWIEDGFNPTTFDTKFKGFRNPNNPNYVINKTVYKKTSTPIVPTPISTNVTGEIFQR